MRQSERQSGCRTVDPRQRARQRWPDGCTTHGFACGGRRSSSASRSLLAAPRRSGARRRGARWPAMAGDRRDGAAATRHRGAASTSTTGRRPWSRPPRAPRSTRSRHRTLGVGDELGRRRQRGAGRSRSRRAARASSATSCCTRARRKFAYAMHVGALAAGEAIARAGLDAVGAERDARRRACVAAAARRRRRSAPPPRACSTRRVPVAGAEGFNDMPVRRRLVEGAQGVPDRVHQRGRRHRRAVRRRRERHAGRDRALGPRVRHRGQLLLRRRRAALGALHRHASTSTTTAMRMKARTRSSTTATATTGCSRAAAATARPAAPAGPRRPTATSPAGTCSNPGNALADDAGRVIILRPLPVDMDALGYAQFGGRREALADRYAPWLYRLTSLELAREGKIDDTQDVRHGALPLRRRAGRRRRRLRRSYCAHARRQQRLQAARGDRPTARDDQTARR